VIGRFGSVAELIAAHRPEVPVHLFRPDTVREQARRFRDGFPGRVLYAVKCNAHPEIMAALVEAGIDGFDVASPHEIRLTREAAPGAELFYHHPAKTPGQIAFARDMGVRHFAVDCPAEVDKLPAGAVAMVRLAIPKGVGAVYDLSTKFGAPPDAFVATLRHAAARGLEVGVTFHVGSQCLDPEAFRLGIRLACGLVAEAGVPVRLMDVGGGFPAMYRLTDAPPLATFFAVIEEARKAHAEPLGIRLACEPGRALVAEGGSLLVRVNLVKPGAVYVNDGIFGGLTEVYWGRDALRLPTRLWSARGEEKSGETAAVTAFGPTCDGNDLLPYALDLPQDVAEGDYVEFGLTGAYGREMAGSYNGMRSDAVAIISDRSGTGR
jgi:ornithine decarboxylase